MKKIFKATTIFLSVLTAFIATSCNNDGLNSDEKNNGEIHIWSQEATVNVMQDVEYDDSFKNVAKYSISAGKGEYEASQLIITVPAGMTAQYTIEVSDLTCGEYTIDKSYIDVYNEKYINVTTTQASYTTGTGWYADALLPFDKAIEYGENVAGNEEKLQNQGIYIETFIPRDTPAGEYVGSFIITVNDKETTIPANVTVYDFEVSQETHLGQDWIVNLMGFGELDTSNDIQYAYFEKVAGYRAGTHSMKMGATNYDEWVQVIRKYTNPNLRDEEGNPLIGEKECYLGSINLPANYNATYGIDRNLFDNYISRLAYWSIKDGYDYLAKVSTYPGFIDEPHYNNTWDKVELCCNGWNEYKNLWANEILAIQDFTTINEKAERTEENALTKADFDNLSVEFKNQLAKSMSLIGFHVTTKPDDRLNNNATTQFCRPMFSFNTAAERYTLDNWTEVETNGDWAYSAGNGRFGNRLDSQPLEQRLMSYHLYRYDIKGFLIWEVAQYQEITWNAEARAAQYTPCDPYTTAQRITNGAGDGFILYPGKPYGMSEPVGSIRAHQYRDSSEEYEYFYLLESLYAEKGYSPDKVLEKIFDNLYDENDITNDTEIFAKQRQEIINLILLAKKDVFVTDYTEIDGTATMSVVSTGEENIVKVNGENVSATKEVQVRLDRKAIDSNLSFATDSGLSFTVYLNGKVSLLKGGDATIFIMVGGTANDVDGEKYIDLSFSSSTFDENLPIDRRAYHATFSINKTEITRETEEIISEFYNPSENPVLIEVWFMGKDGRTTFVDDIVANPKSYASIVTTRLDLVGWSTIRSLEGVRYKVTSLTGDDDYSVRFYGLYKID